MKTSIKLIIFSSVNRYHDFPFFFTSVFCSILPPGLRTYKPPCVLVLMKHPVWIVLLHLSLYKWFMVGKRSNSKARARDTLSKRRAHDIVLPPHHHSLSPSPPYHHYLPTYYFTCLSTNLPHSTYLLATFSWYVENMAWLRCIRYFHFCC